VKTLRLSAVLGLALACAVAAPATAANAFRPYVRVDGSGSGFRMTDVNSNILDDKAVLVSAGANYIDFGKVGTSFGPTVSAGLWLMPCLRVGATYSEHHAVRDNYASNTFTDWYYDDKLDLRTTELGGEAAVRFQRLAGLTFGANYAIAHARATETLSEQDPSNFLDSKGTATRDKSAYGGYVGLEQTNEKGVVGYVHFGFAYRDMGHMPSTWTQTDNSGMTTGTGRSVWMDFSGFYLRVGTGYDFAH
jgi:hypothetical protein